MPEIQAPDLGLAIRELLGIGEANPLVTLSPEVVGVVKLADLTTTAPTGRRMAYRQIAPAAGAGNYSFCFLGNALDYSAEVLSVTVNKDADLSLYVYNPAAYVAGHVGVGLDGLMADALLDSGVDSDAGGTGTVFAHLTAGVGFATNMVLLPGAMVIAHCATDNASLQTSWIWRE